jgi:hypothetical protein
VLQEGLIAAPLRKRDRVLGSAYNVAPVAALRPARSRAVPERRQPDPSDSLAARIWRSVFRGPVLPRSDRERKWIVFNTLLLHLRPIRVPASTLRYTHTFGLGSPTSPRREAPTPPS